MRIAIRALRDDFVAHRAAIDVTQAMSTAVVWRPAK
jgi:hypothetical protein